jgi:hypothetical protein
MWAANNDLGRAIAQAEQVVAITGVGSWPSSHPFFNTSRENSAMIRSLFVVWDLSR